MNRLFGTCTLAAAALALTACQSAPPANQGTSGFRVDPSRDAPPELRSQTPRSQDLVTATNQMAMDMATRLDVVNQQSPPQVFVGRIENQSSLSTSNFQVFLVRLRSQLQQSGARSGIEFVRERQYIEQQRNREYGDADPMSSPDAYQSRADYVLTCEVYDLPSGGTNYFLFNYQLVQLREAVSGANTGAGAIVWENSYEVKYQ